jgi:anti-sigma28 factor (negative regulator of flagellin synthesis)
LSTSNDRSEPERLDAHRAQRRGTTAESVSSDDGGARDGHVHDDDAHHGDTQTPAQFEEASVVRRARQIERLRAAVEAEEYRPNPGQIAESMLENERT